MIRLKSLLLEQYRPEMENTRDTRFKSDAEIEAERKAELEKAKRDLERLEAKRKKLEKEKEEADRLEKERLEKEIQKKKEAELKKKQEKEQLEKEIERERDIWRKEKEAELKKKKEKELEDKKKKELEDKKKKELEDKKKKEKKKSPPSSGDNWFGPISATGNGYEPRGHDAFGHGHWRAKRRNRDGTTRPHRGLDIKSKAGDPVFSPMDCKIKRVYRIYQPGYKQDKCKYLIGVTLKGTGEYSGYVFRLFYVKLASGYKVGQQIKKGDAFAIMQNLEYPCYPPKRNGSRMTNHIHWEYYKDKYVKYKDLDPTPLIGMKKPD